MMKLRFFSIRLAVFFLLSASTHLEASQCGAITQAEGEPQIIRNGQTIPASVGTPVERGDTIRAPKGSHVDFSIDGVAGLSAEEGTECEIAKASEDDILVDLSLGELRANIKKLPSQGTFTVETPTAIAAVRGTQFMSRVILNQNNEPDSSFVVRDSVIDVTAKKSGEKFTLSQGQAIDIPTDPNGIQPGVRSATGQEIVQMEDSSQIMACA